MAIVNRRIRVMHIISGDLWAGAEVQAFTLLKEIKNACALHVVLMNTGELAQRLAAESISITVLDESRLNSLAILLALRKELYTFKPDVIHTHRQKENILGSVANLTSVRAVSVRTSHGAPEFATKGVQKLQVALDRWIGSFVQKAIIAVSADLAEKLVDSFPPEKIVVINNGVNVQDLLRDSGETEFRRDAPGATHIGIIGRLVPVKRVDIFLAMAAELIRRDPSRDYRFHVIGDGKLKSELEQQAKGLGLSNRVYFHGHRQDTPACIRSLDAIVMCSDHEGTPMTALEALAIGTPLIAHQVGGLTDVLADYPQLQVVKHHPVDYANCLINILATMQDMNWQLPERYRSEHNGALTLELYQSCCDQVLTNPA